MTTVFRTLQPQGYPGSQKKLKSHRRTSKANKMNHSKLDDIIEQIRIDSEATLKVSSINDLKLTKQHIKDLKNRHPKAIENIMDHFGIVINVIDGLDRNVYMQKICEAVVIIKTHDELLKEFTSKHKGHKKSKSKRVKGGARGWWGAFFTILCFIIGSGTGLYYLHEITVYWFGYDYGYEERLWWRNAGIEAFNTGAELFGFEAVTFRSLPRNFRLTPEGLSFFNIWGLRLACLNVFSSFMLILIMTATDEEFDLHWTNFKSMVLTFSARAQRSILGLEDATAFNAEVTRSVNRERPLAIQSMDRTRDIALRADPSGTIRLLSDGSQRASTYLSNFAVGCRRVVETPRGSTEETSAAESEIISANDDIDVLRAEALLSKIRAKKPTSAEPPTALSDEEILRKATEIMERKAAAEKRVAESHPAIVGGGCVKSSSKTSSPKPDGI